MARNLVIFDLDETVINSKHRTPNNPDGTLNLAAYRELHTADNVFKDTLLPMANVMRERYAAGDYVVILTARDMKAYDYAFLDAHNLPYHKIMSRDRCRTKLHYNMRDGEYKFYWIRTFLNLKQFSKLPVIMFDDAGPVKSALRRLFPVICAHKANKKLLTA